MEEAGQGLKKNTETFPEAYDYSLLHSLNIYNFPWLSCTVADL